MNTYVRFLIPIAIWLLITNIPVPEGVTEQGWKLLAIFVSTIVAVIAKPMPTGAIALTALAGAVLSQAITLSTGLSAYGESVIWLIVYVFLVARGFIKSNLGTRVAYFFVSKFGNHSLGLGYCFSLTSIITATVVPSSTARAGGILYPIMTAVSDALGSRPNDPSSRRIGGFLVKTAFHANLIAGAMFLTGMAANPLCQKIAASQGIEITWLSWFTAAIVPGIISMLLVPLVIYILYKPELTKLEGVREMAADRLKSMGAMSRDEIVMTIVALGMLTLWIFGGNWGISATMTALLGLCAILITRVISWDDVLQEYNAWNTMIWFAILIGMAAQLESMGVMSWFAGLIGARVTGLEWAYALTILSLIYFYTHYLFASMTAHVGAMYGAFLSVAILTGAPPLLSGLILAFISNLFACTTHYGATAAVILYGAGYVSTRIWWGVGLIVSLVLIAIWGVIGGLWWKALGLW